jgi:SulP family sulfate permease
MYATFLSFLSGAILFLAGVANAGFLVENLLSVPLLTGWIQGAAILIIVSQLAGFLDIKIPNSSNAIISTMQAIVGSIKQTNVASLLIGAVCLVILFLVRKLGETKAPIVKKFPVSLLVLIGVTALSRFLHWDDVYKISIVGTIPQGLPVPGFFTVTWDLITDSLKASLAISIIGFMEGISLAKKFAAMRRYRINVSQELRALGLANMVGSIFSSFPVTGSVTRTSVNYQAGSRTTYSSIVNAILVGCVLLFLAPLFYDTPKTALAAIVMAAGISLIDIHEIFFLWRIRAYIDLVQLLSIFIVTLFTGPEVGAVVAILFSVLHIIYRATRPHFMTLAPVHGTTVYKPEPKLSPMNSPIALKGILVVKLESSVYFYTTAWLKEWLHRWEGDYPTPVNTLIFDGSNMNAADATGVHTLKDIVEEHQKRNVCVFFTNLKPRLRKTMELSGLIDIVGPDSILGTVHEAVELAETISASQRNAINKNLLAINDNA